MIQIPGYDGGEPLGSGGVADVYRVYNRQLQRYEALKALQKQHLGNQDLRQRFLSGARKLAAVQHPNVVPVYTISPDTADVPFFTMRYVPGGDLLDLLRAYPHIDKSVILDLLRQISEGVEAAHRAGILHRDLKPANILIENITESSLHAYVADFDIARTIVRSGNTVVTQDGLPIGTPQYMAPEQIDSNLAEPSTRTDGYGFACVAWELLAGQPPFDDRNPVSVMHAHLQTQVPSISSRKSTIPKAVDAVFYRALSKVPANRYASTSEFVRALESALAPTTASLPKLLVGAVIAAGLLAVGYGLYETTASKAPEPQPKYENVNPTNPSTTGGTGYVDPKNEPTDPEAGTTGNPYPPDTTTTTTQPSTEPAKQADPPPVTENFPGGTWESPGSGNTPKVRLTRFKGIPKRVRVGSSFVVDVIGDLVQDGDLKLKGSVTVELANSDGSSVEDLVAVSTASPNVAMFAPPSEVSIYENGAWSKGPLPTGYLIYETNSDLWPVSQKRRIRLTITPKKPGRLLVRCRATVNEPKMSPYSVPIASNQTAITTQNLPALEYPVEFEVAS